MLCATQELELFSFLAGGIKLQERSNSTFPRAYELWQSAYINGFTARFSECSRLEFTLRM